jgi:phosphomannomutase
MDDLLISVSGVRGLYGRGLTVEVAERYARAFAGHASGEGPIVIGRDSRPSGPPLLEAVAEGVARAGGSCVDLGVVPTPTVGFMVPRLGGSGGIVITASHNPEPWNALKLLDREGEFLGPEDGVEVRRSFERTPPPEGPAPASRVRRDRTAVRRHVEAIAGLRHIDPGAVRDRRLRFVLDGVNGGACEAGLFLLETLGVEKIPVHCHPSLPFPHDPEPRPENLGDLSRAVRETGSDGGLALDPDGDRLALVDGGGRALSEELTLALAAGFWLEREPGPVVVNASTSLVTEWVASRFGVALHRTPVGEAHVVREMKRVGAAIGGEGNGGVILPALRLGRDGLVASALILQALAAGGGTLEGLASSLPPTFIVKRKGTRAQEPDPTDLERWLGEVCPGEIDRTDGVRISARDRWVHVRRSNTEGVLRVIAEAPTREEARRLADAVLGRLES